MPKDNPQDYLDNSTEFNRQQVIRSNMSAGRMADAINRADSGYSSKNARGRKAERQKGC